MERANLRDDGVTKEEAALGFPKFAKNVASLMNPRSCLSVSQQMPKPFATQNDCVRRYKPRLFSIVSLTTLGFHLFVY